MSFPWTGVDTPNLVSSCPAFSWLHVLRSTPELFLKTLWISGSKLPVSNATKFQNNPFPKRYGFMNQNCLILKTASERAQFQNAMVLA